MNIGLHVTLRLQYCLDIRPGVGLLDHMVILVFWGPSILCSLVAAPAYIPISSVGGLPFPHILSSIYYL